MSAALHRARLASGEAVTAQRLRPPHTHWRRPRGRLGPAVSNLALGALSTLLVVAHGARPGRGRVDLAISVQQGGLVVLFVARRPSADTSDRPLDWVLGIVGAFLPMLVRPTERLG